ncbi:MAG: exodeoxyribonuclease VII small subunit [Candidatus Marinimicrobia bacterium]|nr:exodeoxyribonuclease VII small subunit [Candidatus Neomarinimicrobiota bacterium]
MSKDKFNLEEAIKRLEQIVSELETGGKTLEDAIELFEEGMKLSNMCSEHLSALEKRVQILMKKDNGEYELKDFEE